MLTMHVTDRRVRAWLAEMVAWLVWGNSAPPSGLPGATGPTTDRERARARIFAALSAPAHPTGWASFSHERTPSDRRS
jgi:hypothetical protein